MWEIFAENGQLLGFVLAVGTVIVGALGLVGEFGPRSRLWRALPLWALMLTAVGAWLSEDVRQIPYLHHSFAVLAAVCLCCYLARTAFFSHFLSWLSSASQRPWLAWSGLMGCGVILSGLLYFVPAPGDVSSVELGLINQQIVAESHLKPATSCQAVTDRGRLVPLFLAQTEPLPKKQLLDLEQPTVSMSRLAVQLIRVAPPDPSSNCHGWVFLGGQYWLRGQHIPMILQDNGYQIVENPRVDDLAIFRDSDGNVTHSAIVRGFATDGTAILEGKWGWGSRFLHSPQFQVYSTGCTFYRTERPEGHRLRIVVDPPEVPLPRVAG